jgi:CheY-like chemotaxis protein
MQSKTILVVDDDELIRIVATSQIKKLGFVYELAQDGLEALSSAATRVYDLILMDVQMPNLNGLEATQAIRKLEKDSGRSRVPIVAMTANPDKSLCFNAGMDDFLFKPILLDDLRQLLDRWLV